MFSETGNRQSSELEVNKRPMTPGKENRSSSAIDLLLPFAGIQLNGGSSNLHLLDIFDTCPKEIGLECALLPS